MRNQISIWNRLPHFHRLKVLGSTITGSRTFIVAITREVSALIPLASIETFIVFVEAFKFAESFVIAADSERVESDQHKASSMKIQFALNNG